ncbi:MAG: glycoside hydrolase family 172 protein [Thermoguttaceae bacterium]
MFGFMRVMKLGLEAVAAGAIIVWCSQVARAQEQFSYADLVRQLIDLERLALLPAEGETCRQWSSYDRASQYDETSGKYVRWDANGDGHGIIRREGRQQVFAEMEGPGCIFRIWSALPQEGRVKIFLDSSDKPVVDMPFADYFDGKHEPFNWPQLSYRLEDVGSRGQNLYFPIPYQKSCKIVAEDKWGAYYHFNYVTYPKGTRVPTFSPELVRENAAVIQEVNDYLAQRMGTDPAPRRVGTGVGQIETTLRAKAATPLIKLSGALAITELRVKMSFKGREDEMAALRRLVLRITWDDQPEPAVWCPLGDFFGTAPGVNLYKSLATGMTDDGFYSLWYMPFGRSALIEVANEDEVDRPIRLDYKTAQLARPMEQLGYFHCKWHRDIFPLSKDRWPDWVMLRTEGRGRFCGVMLHVWNPRGGWWGEGDEKFFVDGEKFPSTIGTGSEDYFGYAWGNPHLFQKPFHCQTMTQNNAGHQSVLRWHVADNVPFQKSFEGCIEKYFPNERALYACTVCWYQAPGGVDPIQPTPVDQRHSYYVRAPIVAGGFKVVGEPPGVVQTQQMQGWGEGKWGNNDQLWWTGGKPGDKLTVVFAVKKTGTYEVKAVLTKAIDYGIVQLWIDGEKAGGPIDLYHDGVIPTDPPVSLGTHELAEGEHKLTAEIVGANDKAIKAYMFGLDRLIFEEAK